jgi:hypothetical protein
MLQLRFLSGKKAGTSWVARRFPVRIGRAPNASVSLPEEGVWDEHFRLDFDPARGIVLNALPQAMTLVNQQPVEQAVLRNGDVLEAGSVRMQFWLSETHQAGMGVREWLTWIAVAILSLGQIAVVYWLLRE